MSFTGRATGKREKICILHVDDDPTILILSKQILIDINPSFEIDCVHSVDEALNKLSLDKYDIVVSDYEMPIKNGLDLLEELRKNSNDIPLIVFTGKGREDIAIKALNLGAAGYYDKHGNPETVYGELSHGIKAVIAHRRAQEALALSEVKYSKVFQNGPSAVTITRLKDGEIIEANNSVKTLLGYTPEEVIGKTTADLNVWRTPEDRERVMEKLRKNGSLSDLELVLNRKDGSPVTILLSASLIELQKEMCLVASFIDLTELKKAEAALRENELRYRLLADNSHDVIWTMDLDGHFTYVSPSVYKLRGYTPEEVIKQSITEVLTPESAKIVLDTFRKFLETGSLPTTTLFELEQPCKDGSTVWTEVNVNIINDNDGKPKSILGVSRDITERKRAQAALEEKYQAIERIADSVNAGLAIVGKDYRIIWANDRLKKVGLIPGKICYQVFGRTTTCSNCGPKKLFEDGVPLDIRDYESGKEWVELRATPLKDRDGRIIAALELAIPITERKKAEQALKESEERFRSIFESSQHASFISTLEEGVFVEVNDAFAKLMGTSKDALIGRTVLELDIYANGMADRQRMLEEINSQGQFKNLEFKSKRGNELISFVLSSQIIQLKGNKHIFGIITDVTQEKRIAQLFKESEEKFRKAFETGPDGVYISTLKEGKIIDVNDRLVDIFGFSRAELIGKTTQELGVWCNPADRERMLNALKSEGKLRNVELSYRRKSGEIFHVLQSVSFLEVNNRQLTLGTIRDITERKKAEQQLRESNAQLQVANEKLKVVGSLTRHDVRNKLSVINSSVYLLEKQVKDNPLARQFLANIEQAIKQSDKIFELSSQYEKIGVEKPSNIEVTKAFNQAIQNTPETNKISVTNGTDGLFVYADSMLQQLFYNLIDNSLRHGGNVTEIRLHYNLTGDAIQLIYEDNGAGIAKGDKARIFSDGFTTGGSGLGLKLVKKMIETYGWKIVEEGEEGKGAKFVIFIPIPN